MTASPYDVKTLVPAAYLNQVEAALSGVTPEATSSYGAYFTTGRVFPDSALSSYPYSTAGRLLFTDPKTQKTFVCSASVLRQQIVVTAGHCVGNPSTNAAQRYFYTNFLFVPSYNNGGAPVGT